MKIDIHKKYNYSDERPARLLCTDGANEERPVVTMDSAGYTWTHDASGKCDINPSRSLIEVVPKWRGELWVKGKDLASTCFHEKRWMEEKGWRLITAEEVRP